MVANRRRAMFSFMQGCADPSLTVVEEVRVPDFRDLLKSAKVKVSHFLLFNISKASLQIPEFRLRVKDGDIVEIGAKKLYCSYTVKNPFTDVNHCIVRYVDDFAEFSTALQKQESVAMEAKEIITHPPNSEDIAGINLSIIPWLRLEALVQGGFSCIPLFHVGKFETSDDAILSFHLCTKVHHGLVDAYHVHQFIEKLKDNIGELVAQIEGR